MFVASAVLDPGRIRERGVALGFWGRTLEIRKLRLLEELNLTPSFSFWAAAAVFTVFWLILNCEARI